MISHLSFLTQLSSRCVIMCCNDMQLMQRTISVESSSGPAAWHWGSKTENLPCHFFCPPAAIQPYVLNVVCAWRALLWYNSIHGYDICRVQMSWLQPLWCAFILKLQEQFWPRIWKSIIPLSEHLSNTKKQLYNEFETPEMLVWPHHQQITDFHLRQEKF